MSSTVYFLNDDPMDLAALTIMGVSAKEHDRPIGMFGTGLKYAAAILTRLGCEMTIRTHNGTWKVGKSEIQFRDQTFDRLDIVRTCDGHRIELPFTTHLGAHWELWQAFRELYSNCLDEKGHMAFEDDRSAGTSIAVTGTEFVAIARNKKRFFLEGNPIETLSDFEVHPSDGNTSTIYYRGIAAGSWDEEAAFRYNYISQTDLTEDRTIKNLFSAKIDLQYDLPTLTNDQAIRRVLHQPRGTMEHDMDFSRPGKASDEFINVCVELAKRADLNPSMTHVLAKHRKEVEIYNPISLTPYQHRVVTEAIALVATLNTSIRDGEILFVESCGKGIEGRYDRLSGRIIIPASTIGKGSIYLASTLYEETVHRDHGYSDESRAMQNFLFDKLMSLAAELHELRKGADAP